MSKYHQEKLCLSSFIFSLGLVLSPIYRLERFVIRDIRLSLSSQTSISTDEWIHLPWHSRRRDKKTKNLTFFFFKAVSKYLWNARNNFSLWLIVLNKKRKKIDNYPIEFNRTSKIPWFFRWVRYLLMLDLSISHYSFRSVKKEDLITDDIHTFGYDSHRFSKTKDKQLTLMVFTCATNWSSAFPLMKRWLITKTIIVNVKHWNIILSVSIRLFLSFSFSSMMKTVFTDF